ncbi:MAG: DUF3078 domain-containing protein [Bacteroidota bacterium]|nr:DUF3078 domain-containing protein [Bacteroidota bacterium]
MKRMSWCLSFLCLSVVAFSQNDDKAREERLKALMVIEDKEGWSNSGAIGFDLGQLLTINPYVGGGSDRIGVGGAVGFYAKYKRSLLSIKNSLLLNLATQRIGSGKLALNSDESVPFEKALDLLNMGSNVSYQLKEGSKWAYSFDFDLRTQLLPSYLDQESKKIYLKDVQVAPYNTSLVSKIFSPALISIAPGIKWTPDSHWNLFLSPVAGQIIIIGDQRIANLGVHGTKLKDGSTTEYKMSKFGLGTLAKVGYTTIIVEKLNFTSDLGLFADYLDQPQNIDITWINSLGYEIFKGFNILLRADLYYDDNKMVNISDVNSVGGISGTGRRPSIIEQLLITYNRKF